MVYLALFKLLDQCRRANLGTALSWVCFAVSRQIMSRWAALLATALFLTLTYGKLYVLRWRRNLEKKYHHVVLQTVAQRKIIR